MTTYERFLEDLNLDYKYWASRYTNKGLSEIEINKGIELKKGDKTKMNIDDEVKEILLDKVKETGIVKIISDYTSKFYRCIHCKKICDETEIIFYNLGATIISECPDCA